jgi:predicted ArsR family transcriptional regulator
MAATKKSAPEAILSVLRKGPKKGLTAATISDRASINPNTTRATLVGLVNSNAVVVIGRETPSFGRPANLYVVATA